MAAGTWMQQLQLLVVLVQQQQVVVLVWTAVVPCLC